MVCCHRSRFYASCPEAGEYDLLTAVPANLTVDLAMNGRILLVTGGGRGIGASTAILGARRGFAVCVNYLSNREAADAVVRTIVGSGGTAIAVQADVAKEHEVTRLFETC